MNFAIETLVLKILTMNVKSNTKGEYWHNPGRLYENSIQKRFLICNKLCNC